jgi:hypothetical protein
MTPTPSRIHADYGEGSAPPAPAGVAPGGAGLPNANRDLKTRLFGRDVPFLEWT